MNTTIIIPALNPDKKLILLVEKLNDLNIRNIIIVNDGSKSESKHIFKQLEDRCTIITHDINKGKGAALKTAFRYVLDHDTSEIGVVTVDADGQHLPKDVLSVAEALQNTDDHTLIMGVRTKLNDAPIKSKIGNEVTRLIFKFLTTIDLQDTQSGLRGFPIAMLPMMTALTGDRYEYELNMLLYATEGNATIKTIPIETVYIENNRSSHFNPLIDSIRVYWVFAKYITSSLSSTLLDFILFWFFFTMSKEILISLVAARLIASVFNFMVNKNLVFNSPGSTLRYVLKYYSLLVLFLSIGYLLISLLHEQLGMNVVIAKGLVETVLFFLGYYVQRRFIFI